MNVGLGTANFGTTTPQENAFRILDRFIEIGGTIIDTADNYAFWHKDGGESETVIGLWLKTIERRKVEIHTKVGAQPINGIMEGLSKSAITNAVEQSLSRLNTSYLDVLYAHVDDPKTPLEETWRALSDLVRTGIVKKLGISNYRAERIIELNNIIESKGLQPISYAQYRYTVLQPKNNARFGLQVCLTEDVKAAIDQIKNNVTIASYSPLLDGAFEVGRELPDNYLTTSNYNKLQEIRDEARQKGVDPSALVLWKLSEDGLLPLTMTGKLPRLDDNLALFIRQE